MQPNKPAPETQSAPPVLDMDPIILNNIILAKQVSNYKQARGPKIQRYSPNRELLQTYPGHTAALCDFTQASRSGLIEAINKCIIYKGFRWANLSRDLPDETVQQLEPTVEHIAVQLGYVAMLDLEQKHIVKVFPDQKAAAKDRQFKSGASVSLAIREKRKSGGHYFVMYDDCSEAMKEAYLQNNELPAPAKRVNSRSIDQLHPTTNQVIKTFSSVADVLKAMHMSRLSINNALEEGSVVKGYRWRLNRGPVTVEQHEASSDSENEAEPQA
jgi:hypothetical protein